VLFSDFFAPAESVAKEVRRLRRGITESEKIHHGGTETRSRLRWEAATAGQGRRTRRLDNGGLSRADTGPVRRSLASAVGGRGERRLTPLPPHANRRANGGSPRSGLAAFASPRPAVAGRRRLRELPAPCLCASVVSSSSSPPTDCADEPEVLAMEANRLYLERNDGDYPGGEGRWTTTATTTDNEGNSERVHLPAPRPSRQAGRSRRRSRPPVLAVARHVLSSYE